MTDFTCCDISKGQRGKRMYETLHGVNKKWPFEISSDDLINEACSKLTRNRRCISHNRLKSLRL